MGWICPSIKLRCNTSGQSPHEDLTMHNDHFLYLYLSNMYTLDYLVPLVCAISLI